MKLYHDDGLVGRALSELAENSSFPEETEQSALGRLLAKHFRWDGLAITECFSAALEEVNFHDRSDL